MSRYAALLLLLGCLAGLVHADDGRLDAVRAEVRSPSTSSSESSSSDSSHSCDLDGDELGFLGELTMHLVAAPFTVPPEIIGDHYDVPSTFVAYPYARGWGGLMQLGETPNRIDGETPFEWERRFSFRAAVEGGSNFGGLDRLGFTFLADSFTRLGVGGGVHFYQEKQSCGCTDELAVGDVNLLFRFAQSERVQFRTGLGARFLSDRVQTDWGVNFVYGAEAYPFEPVAFSWQLETGTLGNAWVFRANTRLGFVWKYSEAYVGYDYLRIGHVELQGPMVGFRVWF